MDTNKVNTDRIEELIKWVQTEEGRLLCDVDIDRHFINPLMEALGDDVDQILEYLDGMDVDAMDVIGGCFPEIYGKFMTDEVYDALGRLEEKIDKESTRMKEFRKRENERKAEALAE